MEYIKLLERLATKSECYFPGYLEPDKYPLTACFSVAFPISGTFDLWGNFLIDDRYSSGIELLISGPTLANSESTLFLIGAKWTLKNLKTFLHILLGDNLPHIVVSLYQLMNPIVRNKRIFNRTNNWKLL